MKIENLRTEKDNGRVRAVADLVWEDHGLPSQEVYFETIKGFGEGLWPNPHSFLMGCIMPAMHYGEERIFIDGEISPEVRLGLTAAVGWIRHWFYGPDHRSIRIEAKTRVDGLSPARPERAGMFFSGGIDSLGALRSNRLTFAPEHPWSVKDGLLVCGLETDDEEKFEHVVKAVSDPAREAGLTLVPVYTNVRHLNDDWMFWERASHDAIFSAVAHALSRRLTTVSISSTYDIPNIRPQGTHPLLDINYSSVDVLIRHEGLLLSRLDKTRLIAGWDAALRNVRVCNNSDLYSSDTLNCGRCHKCVRTMLGLLALGVLDKATAFPPGVLSEELIESVIDIYPTTICFYEELTAPLAEKGHSGFARVLENKITAYRRRQEKNHVRAVLNGTVRTKLKRFDQKYLDGALRRLFVGRGDASQRAVDRVTGGP